MDRSHKEGLKHALMKRSSKTLLKTSTKRFQVNVRSAFAVTQAVLPEMQEHRFGRILFLSSMAAVNGGGVVSTPMPVQKRLSSA